MEKAVKKYVYSQKDDLIERCVKRASAELVRKGLPKLSKVITTTAIEELQRERDHLAAALNHIIRGVMHLEKCDVLNSPLELMSHIEEYLSAWIVLTNVRLNLRVNNTANIAIIYHRSDPPIAVPWEEIKAMEAAGTLWDWINDNWYDSTKAIAIPGEDD